MKDDCDCQIPWPQWCSQIGWPIGCFWRPPLWFWEWVV